MAATARDGGNADLQGADAEREAFRITSKITVSINGSGSACVRESSSTLTLNFGHRV
jgi:hypothetical protein